MISWFAKRRGNVKVPQPDDGTTTLVAAISGLDFNAVLAGFDTLELTEAIHTWDWPTPITWDWGTGPYVITDTDVVRPWEVAA